jgi:malic enzyme
VTEPFKSSDSSSRKAPATLSAVLMQLAGLIFKREAAMILTSVVVLLGAGAGGVVWAQARLDAGVDTRIAPLEERQGRVEAELVEVRKEMVEAKKQSADAVRISLETNLNVRLIAEALKVRPITIEPSDGGR